MTEDPAVTFQDAQDLDFGAHSKRPDPDPDERATVATLVLSPPVLAFLMAAGLAAAVVFGALPAWQVTRNDAGSHLKDSGRGGIGRAGELRAGRWLVGLQLAPEPLRDVRGRLTPRRGRRG